MKMALIVMILINTCSAYAMQLNPKALKQWYCDIAAGETQVVQETLRQYPGALAQTYLGMTPLHAAVNPHLLSGKRKGSVLAMVTVLIGKGARIEERDALSFTPLAKAARERNQDGIAALLKRGARVHVWDEAAHMTPLGYAIENNDLEAARMLLDAGASPDALIQYRDELVRVEGRQGAVRVPVTSARFIELVASPQMKALFSDYQKKSQDLPALEDEDYSVVRPKSVGRPRKKVRIVDDVDGEYDPLK